MSGPKAATPTPIIAAVRPPSSTEPRAATARVSTPTVIIAKGTREISASGK